MAFSDPERGRAYNRAWNKAHRERMNTLWRAWYTKPENRARRLTAGRRRYVRERALFLARSKAQRERLGRAALNEYARDRRKQEPEKVRREDVIAKSKRRGVSGTYTLVEWREKCSLFANLCAYCGEARKLTVDHKIPLSRGGTNDITNIVPACKPCNSRKGTRTAAEFLVAA